MADEKKTLRCSFCGKREDQVHRMIQGPGVRICDECVQLCMSILDDGYDEQAESYETPEELPTPQELDACRENLRASGGGAVDYILTHEAPGKVLDFLGLQGLQRNWLHSFLDELNEKTAHRQWLFGRYHKDQPIGTKMRAVFTDLIPLE